jgi:Fe2+ or Zn2+ uptake regulation protein
MTSTDTTAVAGKRDEGCLAHTVCRACGATMAVSGQDASKVLDALREALEEQGWQMTTTGLRLCPTCAAREPRT